jgi:hypothetical protein
LFVLLYLNRREILRFAQNDRTSHFFRGLFSLCPFVCELVAEVSRISNPNRLKPVLLQLHRGKVASGGVTPGGTGVLATFISMPSVV